MPDLSFTQIYAYLLVSLPWLLFNKPSDVFFSTFQLKSPKQIYLSNSEDLLGFFLIIFTPKLTLNPPILYKNDVS